MPNANNYALNNYKSYNRSPTSVSQQYFMSSTPSNANSQSPLYLTGADLSGAVYINNTFNVAKEDPGISWVL